MSLNLLTYLYRLITQTCEENRIPIERIESELRKIYSTQTAKSQPTHLQSLV